MTRSRDERTQEVRPTSPRDRHGPSERRRVRCSWRGNDGREQSRRFPTEQAAHDFLDEQMVAKRKAKKTGARYRSPNDLGPTITQEADDWLADLARKGRR